MLAETPPRRRARYARAVEADIDDEMVPIALDLFLRRGYFGASVTDLTAAMGIARPNLYRFFGNKEGLFKRALELHSRRHLAYLEAAVEAPTANEVVRRLLSLALSDREASSGIQGFIGLFSALPDEAGVEEPRRIIAQHQSHAIEVLAARFRRASSDGEFASDTCPKAVAYLLEFVIHGLSLHGRNGVTEAGLNELTEMVVRGLQQDGAEGGDIRQDICRPPV